MVVATRRKHDRDVRKDQAIRTVVMHYPAPAVKIDASSTSNLNVEITSMRTTCSTPTLQRKNVNSKAETINENHASEKDDQQDTNLQERLMKKQNLCLPLERSSSFVATNAQLSIIDISAYDYDAYRHKLIETTLKRQYGNRQAPGNVVLNSIHLNSIGSQTGIQLSEKYSHSLFDFIEEYYDATKSLSKKEKEYLHPLDHFLTKGVDKPETTSRGTETKDSITEVDQVPELVDFREQSPISTPSSPCGRRKFSEEVKPPSKLNVRSRRSFSIPRTSSQTSPTLANTPKPSATRQLFNCSEIVNPIETDKLYERKQHPPVARISRSRTSRTAESPKLPITKPAKHPSIPRKRPTSIVRGKSSSESLLPETAKPSDYSELPSTDHDEKESVSSSGAASSHSYSSRLRDERLVRSRASSLSSRSRAIRTPSQTRPWYIGGNPNLTFNRNHFEKQREPSAKPVKSKFSERPRSTGGRFAWDVPDVPGQHCCDDTKQEVAVRPRTANAASNGRRTPEKKKGSDTVLPVLESTSDLRFNSSRIDLDEFNILNDDAKKTPKARESKRPARSRDKKISSASFVKSIEVADVSKSGKNSSDSPVVVEKSSFGIKPPASRPRSVSRLPVHVGNDKTKIKKMIQDSKLGRPSEGSRKISEKSFGHVGGKSTSIFGWSRRPRTAGCVQSSASTLSPKIELSLEALQSNIDPQAPRLTTAIMDKSKQNVSESNRQMRLGRSTSIGPRRSTSLSKTVDDADSLNKDRPDQNATKQPFLRARSGRYGAPKMNAVGNAKESTAKNEKEKENFKLPTEGSKAALIMRRELKTYINKIKLILCNRDKSLQAKELASLSITEAIIPELCGSLCTREIQDLRELFDRVEHQDGKVSGPH